MGGVREAYPSPKGDWVVRDYPTKRLAQRELDRQIAHVNNVSYQAKAYGQFADFAGIGSKKC